MRQSVGTVLVGLLLLAVTGTGRGGPPDPEDIVAKAIKAAGGEVNLAKFKAMTWTGTGKYYGMGDGLPYTSAYAIQYPDKFRMEIKDVFTIVLNGDKGWEKKGGATKEMDKDQLAEQKEGNYAGWVASLLPLKDKKFTLKALGQVKVGDAPAEAVQVSSKGHRDVILYFDAKTGLMVKSQFQTKSAEMGGKEVKQEAYYSDFQKVQGVNVAMKVSIKRDGKVFVEEEMSEMKFVEKLDNKVFAEP